MIRTGPLRLLVFAALAGGFLACSPGEGAGGNTGRHRDAYTDLDASMNFIAQRYVKLVLGVGHHDPNYVDAYYGPEEWRAEVEAHPPTLEELERAAASLLEQVAASDLSGADEMIRLRHRYLLTQLRAVRARLSMLEGERLSFDEEAKALYDASPPTFSDRHFGALVEQLDAALPPGQGTVAARLERFKREFVIPKARLDTVFRTAIAEARRRTAARMDLPPGETFEIEYVTGKPWSGYNWYQGGARSLIQMNTDLPITIDRAIDLAAHEGYPGHHVYNALLEQRLVVERGWKEFSVYALFSPQSLIAEGTANFGIEMAFPGAERVAYERDVLFPLAGLDPARAEEYARIQELVGRLNYARNEAARRYLDGEVDRDRAAAWLQTHALMTPERAQKSIDFIDAYRSYVINYNLGMDLVRGYVEREGGTVDHPERRWEVFAALLSSPRLPSSLQ